jgi:hypothetical protein
MSCLAWVGAVLQGHKADPIGDAGVERPFNFGDAADIAFDPENPWRGPPRHVWPAAFPASGIAFDVADAPPPDH